jgi:hypothetical protein
MVIPQDQDLHVDALIKYRDGTAETKDLSKRKVVGWCPEAAGKRIDELVLVASDASTYRRMVQDKPIRIVGTNLGCSRYVGTVNGTMNYHTQSASTTESWKGTGLVFQRSPNGFTDDVHFQYKLVGGKVTWSYSGVNQGCSYNAGPVTLQIKPDGSMGGLQMQAWNIYTDKAIRPYYALGWNLPKVPGTITCSNGPHAAEFTPHEFLKTGDLYHEPDAPGDGVLKGTWTSDLHSGGAYDENYTWRLEAQQ